MKAALVFALPDDREQLDTALAADRLLGALIGAREALRQQRKYGDHDEATRDVLEGLWDGLHALIAEHDLNGVMGLS